MKCFRSLKSMFEETSWSGAGYVEQLERLGYVLPQDLSVGLILNGLTSDFAGFVRNYNMHNMIKTMSELHALLIEHGSINDEYYNSAIILWDYALETATCILNMVSTKKVDKTPYELWYGKVPKLSYLKVWGCEALVERDMSNKLQKRTVKCIFVRYPKEIMEISRRAKELEEIQNKDTSPSEITSEIPMKVEGFEPPQEEVIPVCRSARTHRDPNRLCLNVEVEEHSLRDLNESNNYKAALLDLESNK
ncbi:hypothetical protein Tco_1193393 [Tanacetum coccineum]